MKDNHIPRNIRIQNRINKLFLKEEECWAKSPKSFYKYCKYCDLDVISINMEGHRVYCKLRGIENQIKYYQELLKSISEKDKLK